MLRDRAEAVRVTHDRIAVTFEGRDRSPADWQRWQDACNEARAALLRLYSPELEEMIAAIPSSHPDALESGLVFLEVDPWCFRSGYYKQRILRKLRATRLDHEHQERLAKVLLHAVDVGDRWEFRDSCRLARLLPVSLLCADLVSRLGNPDPGRRRRALWMLAALRRPHLSPTDLMAARRVVLEVAALPRRWNDSTPDLYRRFWSYDWEDELLSLATSDASARRPVLRLLRTRRILEGDRFDRVASIAAAAVADPNDGTWPGWISLAVAHGPPDGLRGAIEPLTRSTEKAVRSQAASALWDLDEAE